MRRIDAYKRRKFSFSFVPFRGF